MRTILYIGNHLSRGGAYPSVAESLAPHLLPELRFRLVSHHRNKALRMLHMLWAVLRHGRREQPVLIDTYSSLNFWYALFCGLLCRLLAVRYYCVLRGGNLPGRLQRSPMLCRWLFGGAALLTAPSAYLQTAFRKRGYQVEVIPNPIPMDHYPFKFREKVRPCLLWVRAFSEIYNPRMAIRVLHRLVQQHPDARLCMVGPDKDGSLEACRKLASELGVEDKVRFTGLLPKAEWIALSREYDIFINTTRVDNTPVSVIEAMALGLPVVSTKVGGMAYLIEDGKDGLLVDGDDPERMCAALNKILIEEKLGSKFSIAGRKKVATFDIKEVSKKWKSLLVVQRENMPNK